MWYVYLLQSETVDSERYVGITSDLKRRIGEHNAGKSTHTSKFLPWRIVTYVAFSDQAKAASFERYVKSGSGHAFANNAFGECSHNSGELSGLLKKFNGPNRLGPKWGL
ncbi:GIY-YIG nuclease family protein [Mesorhizobium sp. Cs1321R2N1]|uniref:GIY-YIG nuclease family protein n=1 Tax=Mesorhizobium sp. Cs1321R2N1 TaxID=3015174 RepID=UPI00301B9919